jgi:hypothetical protein
MKNEQKKPELAQVIFDPRRMDAKARDENRDSPEQTADELRVLHLEAYRRADALLKIAAHLLEVADGGWICESPSKQTVEMIQAARKELGRTTRTTREVVARLDKMRQWPKMRQTA